VIKALRLAVVDEWAVRVGVEIGGLVRLDLFEGVEDVGADLEVAGPLALLPPSLQGAR
jgi:hypothetical protein